MNFLRIKTHIYKAHEKGQMAELKIAERQYLGTFFRYCLGNIENFIPTLPWHYQ